MRPIPILLLLGALLAPPAGAQVDPGKGGNLDPAKGAAKGVGFNKADRSRRLAPLALVAEPVPGEAGSSPPQAGARPVEGRPVHRDTVGSSPQMLAALAGAPGGGFAALWTDHRDGAAALYLGLLDREGRVAVRERTLHDAVHLRQLQAGVALSEGLAGAAVWLGEGATGRRIYARFFEGSQDLPARPFAIGPPTPTRSVEGPMAELPAVAMHPGGGGTIVWLERGAVWSMRFLSGWQQVGANVRLNAEGPLAVERPHAVLAGSGDYLAAWSAEDGSIQVFTFGGDGLERRSEAGAGRLRRVVADPAGGGFTALVETAEGGAVLRSMDLAGRVTGEDVSVHPGPFLAADLAAWRGGQELAVLLELEEDDGDPRTASGEFLLLRLDRSGQAADAPIVALPDAGAVGASGPMLAAQDDALVVAWSDRRAGDADVWFRRVDAIAPSRTDRRWNTDRASADQLDPDAASHGERAAVTWTDLRHGGPRVRVRLFGPGGLALTDDLPLGAPGARRGVLPSENVDASPGVHPAVAVDRDGRTLVAWKREVEGGFELWGQVLAADGRVVSIAHALDPGGRTGGEEAADAVALGGGRGFTVVWVRDGEGPMALRIDSFGLAAGAPHHLAQEGHVIARLPSACVLDDDRLVVVWSQAPEGEVPMLRGRFLRPDASPDGYELQLCRSPDGGEVEASVAPGIDGGFALAWTGNALSTRDCLVAQFDATGQPRGPAQMLTTLLGRQAHPRLVRLGDGTWLAAWDDDLSGARSVVARRVVETGDPLRPSLGPAVSLSARTAPFVPDRRLPALAPLGAGVICAWDDCRRSKGHDVVLCVLESGFDEPDELLEPAGP